MSDTDMVTLVTGAGRGIGRQIALRLGSEGHLLGLTARTSHGLTETARLVGESGGTTVTATGDVNSAEDVEHVCRTVEDAFGPIDALVNNAGVIGGYGPFMDTDPQAWWSVIETNLRGPMLFMRRVLPSMIERGRGHVINVNSKAAFWTDPRASGSAYGVSKAALTRLTETLATELSGTGVILVDLSPGMVRTSMTDQRPDVDDLPPEAFTPPSAAAEHVAALLSGRYDALHGRFVHVLDDLDDLLKRIGGKDRARTLVLAPTDPDDPVTG
jgi:3-oxoacyl-[acyl-carrier protein] reductase